MLALREQLHPEWIVALGTHLHILDEIQERLPEIVYPQRELMMRAFSQPLSEIRIVIIGQDPYPTLGYANGLAFSVDNDIAPLPASLRNILKELADDLGAPQLHKGDLSSWANNGVFLLNRSLSYDPRSRKIDPQWNPFTERVVEVLAERDLVGILWGQSAQELGRFFNSDRVITSPHPSPLSAYRGFFGSKPFSKANGLLRQMGLEEINWSI